MSASTNSRARRMFARVRQIWAELDYAQRRLFEIRTGVPLARRHDDGYAFFGGPGSSGSSSSSA